MPTYQYACTECQHSFEQFQSFTDDALTVCPQCEGRLRKVFNAVGVVFKGSGFYRTDSRTADAKATTESKTDATTDAGANGKPAEKSDSGSSSGGSSPSTSDKPATTSGSSTAKAASPTGPPSAA